MVVQFSQWTSFWGSPIIKPRRRGEAHGAETNVILQMFLTIAVIWDFKSERIPNWLIAAGLICGSIIRIGILGDAWYQVLWGVVCPVLICFILFLMHALGAGDIKLFSVIGCFWSTEELFICMVCSFVAGGAISISKLLIQKQLFESMSCFYHYFQKFFQTYKIEKYPGRDIKSRQMHFSVAIYIGFFLTLGVTYGEVFSSFM